METDRGREGGRSEKQPRTKKITFKETIIRAHFSRERIETQR